MDEDFVGLLFLLASLVGLPAVCVFVTRQAAEGLIGRNASGGIRTRYTKASDTAWIAGHAAALPVVKKMWLAAGAGVLLTISAQVLVGGEAGAVVGVAALLAQTGILLRAASAANSAARSVTDHRTGKY